MYKQLQVVLQEAQVSHIIRRKINADKLMKSGSGVFLVATMLQQNLNCAGTSIEFISILVPAFFFVPSFSFNSCSCKYLISLFKSCCNIVAAKTTPE